MKGYPRRFRRALIGTVALAWLSGLLLAPTTLALRADLPLPWRLASGSRVGMAAFHGGTAFVLLFLCGALWAVHMRAGWHRHRQRASGAIVAGLMLLLAVTALVLYYAGEDAVANAAAAAHLAAGTLLVLPFAWHWRRGHAGSTRRTLGR